MCYTMEDDDMETYIINSDIEELNNEIKTSSIRLNIEKYQLFFQPILEHNISSSQSQPLLQNNTSMIKYREIKTVIINKSNYYMIKKDLRHFIKYLPLIYKNDILTYLTVFTINILLKNNIYTPLNNQTVKYDMINKIPIIIDFKKSIFITKWQNKNVFLQKFNEDIQKLLFQ